MNFFLNIHWALLEEAVYVSLILRQTELDWLRLLEHEASDV